MATPRESSGRLRSEPATTAGEQLAAYLREIESAWRLGNDTEATHRPALKALQEAPDEAVVATNLLNLIECGAMDLVVARRKDGLVPG